jgi:acylpyruvate hydrolase
MSDLSPRHALTLAVGPHAYTPGKVLCVGRNYARHSQEMGLGPDTPPVFFLKSPTALLYGPLSRVSVPVSFGTLHHEIELAVLLGRRGRVSDPGEEREWVAGLGVALDLTLRELQARAKAEGGPWDLFKGFDGAAPIGLFAPPGVVGDPYDLEVHLSVNGETRQRSRTSLMLHRVGELLVHVSRYLTLEPGDILLTGTPEGVGPLEEGDLVHAEISGLPELSVEVKRPPSGVIEGSVLHTTRTARGADHGT